MLTRNFATVGLALANFVSCEAAFLACFFGLGYWQDVMPRGDLQLAGFGFALQRLPLIFLITYSLFAVLLVWGRGRSAWVGYWFLPGFTIGSLYALLEYLW